jgi:beta-glucanase (GH16 family)
LSVLFKSNFEVPDPRWVTRHTPDPDLPASELAPKYRKDGRLEMRLIKKDGIVHTSHIATERTFLFGRFEARMRFKGPKGAHSAFWLQDLTDVYGPGRAEVDIIEHFGENRLWHNTYWRTANSAPWPHLDGRRELITLRNHGIDPREWHVYGCEWREDRYDFFIDGAHTATITEGLSSTPKVMILSLLSSDYEWDDLQPDNLKAYRTLVDWVKVTSL